MADKKFSLDQLTTNPDNPRKISDEAMRRLMESIRRDGDAFMALRPIVYAPGGMVLGGNQRLAACRALGMKEVPATWAVCADTLTAEQQRRFILVDNGPEGMAGEWDYECLRDGWDDAELVDLGFELPEYCAVILQRMHDAFGLDGVLVNG